MLNKLKHFHILLVLVLGVSLIVLFIFNVFAASTSITVNADNSVNIGHSFDVNCSLDSSVGIRAIMLNVEYNQDYISFKDMQSSIDGAVDYYTQDDKTTLICLFDAPIQTGDFLTLQFTAKTGNESSSQELNFVCEQVVDSNLNGVNASITDSISIDIVKASDLAEGTASSNRTGNTASSGLINSKSTSGTSSKGSSSNKSVSSSSSSNPSKRIFADTEESYTLNESEESSYINSAVGQLNEDNSKTKYVLAGAGLATAFFIILLVAYRSGQMSMEKKIKGDEEDSKEKEGYEEKSTENKDKESNKDDDKTTANNANSVRVKK